MPYRKIPLIAGEIYHVFNRSIARQPIFRNVKDYQRVIDLVNFYRFQKPPLRFSHYNRLSIEQKEEFIKRNITNNSPMVSIITYCIMPTHFHFLLRPLASHAISKFMTNVQHSYSKYFNTKYERTGSLFQLMFKAVRIETDEQLLHVSRYIHLNPITSYLLEINKLEGYFWSSFREYIFDPEPNSFVNAEVILDHFKSRDDYKQFVFDQADYQKDLDKIRHLSLE